MVSFPRLLHNLHHRGISNKRELAIVARKAMSNRNRSISNSTSNNSPKMLIAAYCRVLAMVLVMMASGYSMCYGILTIVLAMILIY